MFSNFNCSRNVYAIKLKWSILVRTKVIPSTYLVGLVADLCTNIILNVGDFSTMHTKLGQESNSVGGSALRIYNITL